MVTNDMLEKVMKSIARDISRSTLAGTAYDYLIEAQFIGLFNNFYIRRQV